MTMDTHSTTTVQALLDNGAAGSFADRCFIHNNGLKTCILPMPIKVYNVNGTLNQGGSITEEITFMMLYKRHKKKAMFKVCDLGRESLIIGLPWL
jgi:hypothetical protein